MPQNQSAPTDTAVQSKRNHHEHNYTVKLSQLIKQKSRTGTIPLGSNLSAGYFMYPRKFLEEKYIDFQHTGLQY